MAPAWMLFMFLLVIVGLLRPYHLPTESLAPVPFHPWAEVIEYTANGTKEYLGQAKTFHDMLLIQARATGPTGQTSLEQGCGLESEVPFAVIVPASVPQLVILPTEDDLEIVLNNSITSCPATSLWHDDHGVALIPALFNASVAGDKAFDGIGDDGMPRLLPEDSPLSSLEYFAHFFVLFMLATTVRSLLARCLPKDAPTIYNDQATQTNVEDQNNTHSTSSHSQLENNTDTMIVDAAKDDGRQELLDTIARLQADSNGKDARITELENQLAITQQRLEQDQADYRQHESFRQLQEIATQEIIATAERRAREEERVLAKSTLDTALAEFQIKHANLQSRCAEAEEVLKEARSTLDIKSSLIDDLQKAKEDAEKRHEHAITEYTKERRDLKEELEKAHSTLQAKSSLLVDLQSAKDDAEKRREDVVTEYEHELSDLQEKLEEARSKSNAQAPSNTIEKLQEAYDSLKDEAQEMAKELAECKKHLQQANLQIETQGEELRHLREQEEKWLSVCKQPLEKAETDAETIAQPEIVDQPRKEFVTESLKAPVEESEYETARKEVGAAKRGRRRSSPKQSVTAKACITAAIGKGVAGRNRRQSPKRVQGLTVRATSKVGSQTNQGTDDGVVEAEGEDTTLLANTCAQEANLSSRITRPEPPTTGTTDSEKSSEESSEDAEGGNHENGTVEESSSAPPSPTTTSISTNSTAPTSPVTPRTRSASPPELTPGEFAYCLRRDNGGVAASMWSSDGRRPDCHPRRRQYNSSPAERARSRSPCREERGFRRRSW